LVIILLTQKLVSIVNCLSDAVKDATSWPRMAVASPSLTTPDRRLDAPELSAGLSKRVKAKERKARALMRLIKPNTIETGFCVSEAVTKSRLCLLNLLE
jgi:hypothetical protein